MDSVLAVIYRAVTSHPHPCLSQRERGSDATRNP